MEDFVLEHRNELLWTGICLLTLLILRFISSKTIKKVGKLSHIVEARTLLITKYVSVFFTALGIGILGLIWGIDFRNLGLLFSSVFAVIGVALFANWSILSNITAGVILFFSFPFKIGDRIKIWDKEFDFEETYIIEDIKAFHVHLRKNNGELLTYPNNLMIQKAVTTIFSKETSDEGNEEH
ncbi:mechanosensitive ion channel family protein [Muriicola sp. Z0-33]|uniref:mechanosensitive ion channel family protein n=1 Tax=Muriicola sp. Z0-33 TaxID=2816957 RepID=UPI0022386DBD|nr:mechanosensitive ion channel family protein [Muriicola sp. Z0-33]MCW5515518.1 mechanosensitive ion channel [Muriicola sp. Z0-33]